MNTTSTVQIKDECTLILDKIRKCYKDLHSSGNLPRFYECTRIHFDEYFKFCLGNKRPLLSAETVRRLAHAR